MLIGCRKLTEQGYRLALDDFVWFDGAEALLELAAFVKIDVQAVRGAELAELVERCRRYDVQLVAEKIETVAELECFRDLGFELFQGYLLDRPHVVSGRTLEQGQASRVRMATVLLNGDFDLDALDDLLRSDPGLAYQVMQLASLGRPGEFRLPRGRSARASPPRSPRPSFGPGRANCWRRKLTPASPGWGSPPACSRRSICSSEFPRTNCGRRYRSPTRLPTPLLVRTPSWDG